MADLKVRNLDERIADVLRLRAKQRGVSLEEEVRQTLTASVVAKKAALLRRAAAHRASMTLGAAELDSARIIREERDAWG